ncbi:hypothetical protein [Burkholderia gladioli]|uniref:hypothetical protein n=1 Tax=Burkholderia gladioli TaxID=28095 RepID=UPI0038B3FC5E
MPGSRKTSLIAPAMAPKRVEARESPPAPGLAPQAEHLVAMGEFHYAAAAGSPLQRRATNAAAGPDSAGPSTAAGPANRNAPANRTGLPDRLKAGIESLSGYSLDKVKVSYNSSRPAQLMAHAYARATRFTSRRASRRTCRTRPGTSCNRRKAASRPPRRRPGCPSMTTPPSNARPT